MMDNEFGIDCIIKELKKFPNNSRFANLAKKSILVISPVSRETLSLIESTGARKVTCLCDSPEMVSLSFLLQRVSSIDHKEMFDIAFLDMQCVDKSELSSDAALLYEMIRRIISPNGAMFTTTKVGRDDQGFDVPNMFIFDCDQWIATRSLVFDSFFRSWAIRLMKSKWGIAPQSDLLLLRLTPKKPIVLLICGESMSGKTTLARELTCLSKGMHISNDFIYNQLVKACASSSAEPAICPSIRKHLGDGSGLACGNFNRALEAVEGLLENYLPHLKASIPSCVPLVSVDFDLRTDKAIESVGVFLEKNGFSVWLVRRPKT